MWIGFVFVFIRGLLCRWIDGEQTTKSHEPGITKRHKESDYRKLIDARDTANAVVRHHKEAYKSGDLDGPRFVEPMRDAQLILEHVSQHFRDQIMNESRRI